MTSSPLAVLLDLDGTLMNSQPGIVASCNAAIRGLGYEPDPSLDLSAVIGPPIDEVMRYLLARHGDDRVTEAVAAYREHYGAKGIFESAVYPGVPEAMDVLVAAGATLHVATSKRTVFARRILDHFGLTDRLAGIYGSEGGGALDSKPELIAHLLEREEVAVEHCVMVGDRRYDISGAHANRLRAIGVLWGYGSRDELETAGADRLIEYPGNLPSVAVDLTARLRE